jgi:hypothetical protein
VYSIDWARLRSVIADPGSASSAVSVNAPSTADHAARLGHAPSMVDHAALCAAPPVAHSILEHEPKSVADRALACLRKLFNVQTVFARLEGNMRR